MGEVREVLIVDDSELFRRAMMSALATAGYAVFDALDQAQALALIAARPTLELAVIDLRLEHESGLAVLRAMLAVRPSMRCVMLTGYCSSLTAVEALRAGAIDCLPKSAHIRVLLSALEARDEPGASDDDVAVPSLAQIEWEHIQRVLHDCDGNISLAARRLGILRQSLQRKLRRQAPPR